MGWCESATASIGLKILLSDLVSQINESNFMLVKDMLHNGFIEDGNDYFNEVYSRVIRTMPKDFLNFKEYLTDEFKNNGSFHKSRNNNVIPTLDKGCLFDKYLLVSIKDILTMDRWGHERTGSNVVSRPINFDLTLNTEKYKQIEKTEIVFLLAQHAG